MSESVLVVGAGLAGSEAAWQLARRGIAVELLEMRPERTTPAHRTARAAELVCTNSFKSDTPEVAAGLLKEELRQLGSLILRAAGSLHTRPAGAACGAFVAGLVGAERVELRDFEKTMWFEACLPVEELARRGPETLRFGPLKPLGLTDPRTGQRPYAVVQLRPDDAASDLFNLVGFQTNLRRPEQRRLFRSLPGLANAEFARLGVMHRNTYVNSPAVLLPSHRLRSAERTYLAGQLVGVEGYLESAMSGLVAAVNVAAAIAGAEEVRFPADTAIGSLVRYVTTP